jgi:hypothetical protein
MSLPLSASRPSSFRSLEGAPSRLTRGLRQLPDGPWVVHLLLGRSVARRLPGHSDPPRP